MRPPNLLLSPCLPTAVTCTHNHTHTLAITHHTHRHTHSHCSAPHLPVCTQSYAYIVTSRLVHSSPKRAQNTFLKLVSTAGPRGSNPRPLCSDGRTQRLVGLAVQQRFVPNEQTQEHSIPPCASLLPQGLGPHFSSVPPAHCSISKVRVLLYSPGWDGTRQPASVSWV